MAVTQTTISLGKRSIPAFFSTRCCALRLFIPILSIWLLSAGLPLESSTILNPILISNYTLVSVTPAGGRNYDFACRATATNKGKAAISSLVLSLTLPCKKSYNAIESELNSDSYSEGAAATNSDTL